jgi:GNAT superfamily N-acetyltransferase
LVIHPKYQGRGIGTKLLKVGVVEAQRLKLPAWVEASPAGQKVYKRCGFRDAERLELDFAKYGFKGVMHIYCMLIDDVNK